MSVAEALFGVELTSLRVSRRGDAVELRAARQWDGQTDFSQYGRDFGAEDVPCRSPRALGDPETRSVLRRVAGEIEELEGWMRAGRHESVRLFVSEGIRVIHFIHSSTLGRQQNFHALRAGGIRRHAAGTAEREVFRDGLLLSRAMSFKCALAEVPFGGSKSSVECACLSAKNAAALGLIAFTIDSSRLLAGPDVGFSPPDRHASRALHAAHRGRAEGIPRSHGKPHCGRSLCGPHGCSSRALGQPQPAGAPHRRAGSRFGWEGARCPLSRGRCRGRRYRCG